MKLILSFIPSSAVSFSDGCMKLILFFSYFIRRQLPRCLHEVDAAFVILSAVNQENPLLRYDDSAMAGVKRGSGKGRSNTRRAEMHFIVSSSRGGYIKVAPFRWSCHIPLLVSYGLPQPWPLLSIPSQPPSSLSSSSWPSFRPC